MVDTNILLAATDRSRRSHEAALALLNHDARRLAVTPQIIREYLVVATRPVAANGLGKQIHDANIVAVAIAHGAQPDSRTI